MQPLKSLAMFSLLLPALLLADHIEIGSRPMNDEATAQIGARKTTEGAEEEDALLETAGYVFDRYPPIFYSSSHHRLVQIVVRDNGEYTLELEDGSIWKISNYDATKALHWQINDPLSLTQNNRWFSRHDYRIINKANGTTIEASLFLGPVLNGEYSRYIISINHTRKEIILNDSTLWDVSYLDGSIFKDWALNDYIIIGTNSNTSIWDTADDAILINVNMNNCVRAKQY